MSSIINKIIAYHQKNKKQLFALFFFSIFGGLAIAIGGIAFLSILINNEDNNLIFLLAALLFASGLFIICTYQFPLFTGAIGFIVYKKADFIYHLLIILAGNYIGVLALAQLIRIANPDLITLAQTIMTSRIENNNLNSFLLAIPCGFLMFFAVNSYIKLKENLIARYIPIFLGVSVFIVCRFEHIIANLFFLSVAGINPLSIFDQLILTLLGNIIGAIAFSLPEKLRGKY